MINQVFKTYALAALLVFSASSLAAERNVRISVVEPPTMRADDTPLDPSEIASYNIYASYCNGTNKTIEQVQMPYLDTVVFNQQTCEVTYEVTTVDTFDVESETRSVPAVASINVAPPNPPTGIEVIILTVTVTAEIPK